MATTHTEFDCYYDGGATLLNQTFCPASFNGQTLDHTEFKIVEDVESKTIPWWLLFLAVMALREINKRK